MLSRFNYKNIKMKEFVISKNNEGQRFDKYLSRILSNGGMSFIYKMIRKKNFVLNDKKATGKEILQAGDVVKLYISDDTYNQFKTEICEDNGKVKTNGKYNISDSIIYEDDDIILINKPANILSQKASQNDVSLNEYILEYLKEKNSITRETLLQYKPSVINRLDRNTTGIIIAAKNLRTAQVLSESLKNRTINKYYKCLVNGKFTKNGLHKGFLTKDKKLNTVKITDTKINDESSFIETEYKSIDIYDDYSLVEVHLITGKSHQIRAHLAYLGFPIIGDSKYGKANVNKTYKAKNQMLHAYKLMFPEYDADYNFLFSGKTFICEPDFKIV